MSSLSGQSLCSVAQLERSQVEEILATSVKMRELRKNEGVGDVCKGSLLAMLFYEPSTRTQCSFHAAALRLGMQVVSPVVAQSSVKKGETLEDTVRTMQSYCDALVLRHPEIGSAQRAAHVLSIPVLNAGDGAGEHPTQALLDVFTMQQELGRLDGITVTMVGDLKHGRTVHSLSRLLTLFDNITLNFISPAQLAMPDSIKQELATKKDLTVHEGTDVQSVLADTNVLYVTRIQKERFASEAEYDAMKHSYVITPELLSHAPASATDFVVMHPLPRINEISVECDSDPRAAYFRQMENGLYVRMALIALLLGKRV